MGFYFTSWTAVKCRKKEQIGTCADGLETTSELESMKISYNLFHYSKSPNSKMVVLTEHASTPSHLTKLIPGPGVGEAREENVP